MTSDLQREYYDTGIWVAYMLKGDKFSKPSKKLLDDLASSNKTVIVPDLVLVEATHVLRRRIVESLDPTLEPDQALSEATSRYKSISTAFLIYVAKMEARGKIEIYEPHLLLSDYYKKILTNIDKPPIRLRSAARRYQYRGLGPADIEHVYLACHAGVSVFRTTDRSFEYFRTDPTFTSMSFDVLDPESI